MVSLPDWPNFLGSNVIDLELHRIQDFLDKIGNPENKINNIIHVAGTNGKGSTIAFLRALLEDSGYSVNCYTSPHLISFNERIRIKGKLISDQYLKKLSDFCSQTSQKHPEIKLTFFEGTTILSIMAFADNPADFNIFEVGMGGRLDATNIFKRKLASVITPISYDHEEFLGNNLIDIAKEKVGIIQNGSKNFIGKQEPQIYNLFEELPDTYIYDQDFYYRGNLYYEYSKAGLKSPINIPNLLLEGEHQKSNFILALKTFLELTNYQNQNFSLNKIYWPGRITYLHDLPEKYSNLKIWVDGGHNQHAAKALVKWVKNNNIDHVIIGLNNSKDIDVYLREFNSLNISIYFTEMTSFKDCYKVEDVDRYSRFFKQRYMDVIDALDDINDNQELNKFIDGKMRTKANNDSRTYQKILICGSLYLVGEVMHKLGIDIL